MGEVHGGGTWGRYMHTPLPPGGGGTDSLSVGTDSRGRR